ncbi:hypothetical protein ZOSMA_192G00440 [Zostera marina]|uniref:RIN4 pathogenic type III effector avirulence factor Avr cleavage site domain-containing protein n=1 Tax=Zostera marina TaxID=29655 RepID=A0A0K9PRL0_ZOSMR|nr:hypothetical protein ZOSMA_192G00440 [Zostera marina]
MEENGRMGVPQFGGWDEKTEHTDYSMVFKKARATRKQKKVEVHHVSSKNEELVVPKQHTVVPKQQTVVPKQRTAKEAPIMRKRKIFKFPSCCEF